MITLPGSEDVTQVNIGRDPGVRTPAPVSSGLRELGSAINQVGQQFQQANDARVLSNLEADTATKFNDFHNELESDPDSFEQWEGKFKEFSKNHLAEVQKSGVNRTVLDSFTRTYAPMQERSRVRILGRARETMVDKGLTELKTNLKAVQGLAITSNKNDRDIYVSQADLMIERAQDTGYIKDSTAQSLRDEFRGGTERARFENAVDIDPELAKEGLGVGDFEVSEKERPGWNKYVDTEIKQKKIQDRIDAERAREESYYNTVRGVNEWIEQDKSLYEVKKEFLPVFKDDSKGAEKIRKYIEGRFKDQNAVDWNLYIAGQNEIDRRAEIGDPMTNEEVELNYGADTGKQLRHLLSRNTTAIKRMSQQSYIRANKKLSKSLGAGDFGTPTGKKAKRLYAEIGKELTQYMDDNPQGDASDWVEKRMLVNDKENLVKALDGWSPFSTTEFEKFEELSDNDLAIELLTEKGVPDPSDSLIRKVLANTEFQQFKLNRLEVIKESM